MMTKPLKLIGICSDCEAICNVLRSDEGTDPKIPEYHNYSECCLAPVKSTEQVEDVSREKEALP